jgi:hypothetical protein
LLSFPGVALAKAELPDARSGIRTLALDTLGPMSWRLVFAERLRRSDSPAWARALVLLILLPAVMSAGRKEEAERQLAHAKTLREKDEASSRLQLRLLDPDR